MKYVLTCSYQAATIDSYNTNRQLQRYAQAQETD